MTKNLNVSPFSKRIYLASPTMHGDELRMIQEAIDTNWVSTIGENIDAIEQTFSEMFDRPTVALSSGTAALHMTIRAAGERIYGKSSPGVGVLAGKTVFCSDLTFAASLNPILYENGTPVLIDSEMETWNMDPNALERAFRLYPDVKLVVLVHLYGTPAKLSEIQRICREHNAVLIEDAAESLGSTYLNQPTGSFGDYSVISFNGNKIITGSSGGIALATDAAEIAKIRKWSAQSRESAQWYQHEELGYNYRMSNLIAGVIRGQIPYLSEHILKKKVVFERYRDGLRSLPIDMGPFDSKRSAPNHWLSCITVRPEAMCSQKRRTLTVSYSSSHRKSCPTEIEETLRFLNVESRPLWKPMHLQPLYRGFPFITASDDPAVDVGSDLFARGLCLPSDIKMTAEQQQLIIEAITSCFD